MTDLLTISINQNLISIFPGHFEISEFDFTAHVIVLAIGSCALLKKKNRVRQKYVVYQRMMLNFSLGFVLSVLVDPDYNFNYLFDLPSLGFLILEYDLCKAILIM